MRMLQVVTILKMSGKMEGCPLYRWEMPLFAGRNVGDGDGERWGRKGTRRQLPDEMTCLHISITHLVNRIFPQTRSCRSAPVFQCSPVELLFLKSLLLYQVIVPQKLQGQLR